MTLETSRQEPVKHSNSIGMLEWISGARTNCFDIQGRGKEMAAHFSLCQVIFHWNWKGKEFVARLSSTQLGWNGGFRSLFCSHAKFSSLVFMVYWTHFAKKKLFFALFENLPEKVFLFLPPGLYFCYVCDIMFALIILYQHLLKIILEWFACLLYFDMSAWFMSAL